MKNYPCLLYAIFIALLSIVFASCTENETPQPSIKKEKVSGYVQKGPFVSGTNVLMNELTGNFSQTGKVFTSQISNDRGLFEFNDIRLSSSFVEFTSTGFYYNEVEGKISSSPITLTSLSDIRDKNSVNVNILTHLQKKRIEFLIKNPKSYAEAKNQSQTELLNEFKMILSGKDFDSFDIAENNEEGGLLLAISIILQGNRSVGELTELLSRIQIDFAPDGKIDDKSILNALIVSTVNLDYDAIRKNLEDRFRALNITTPVPDFKKHIVRFLNLKNLTITVEGAGRVDQKIISFPSGKEYPQGTTVELTAIPNQGWEFVSWAGSLTGSESPMIITVDAEKNITAKFKRRNYPLNITIQGEGSVEQKIVFNPTESAPTDGTYPFESIIELTPIPGEGWVFERWEGNLTGNTLPDSITINGEKNITAVFRNPIFRLAENGVTCVCENVKPGEKGMINGVEFEAVDYNLLVTRRDQNADMTKLCTSLVTTMEGLFQGKNFNQSIGNWDVSNVTSMAYMFRNSIFNQPIGHWNVSKVKAMWWMFYQSSFNQPIGDWDVSNVTTMSGMFWDNALFNQPIGNWDVGNVSDMDGMFSGGRFNHPIGNWNVSNVRRMASMFKNSLFNQDISNWNVSNVISMGSMFEGSSFNQPIGKWNVSNVIDMFAMFFRSNFNNPLNEWNVGNVANMGWMFKQSSFNQPIGDWDVSTVTIMGAMFWNNDSFNQPIGNWDVGNVTDMDLMFAGSRFNQPIGNWNVSNVRRMGAMFASSAFNQDIATWNVSNVTNMSDMFKGSNFNQPIGNWDVRNVGHMNYMFERAYQFNQDLSKWCVTNISSKPVNFDLGVTDWVLPQPVWGTCPE